MCHRVDHSGAVVRLSFETSAVSAISWRNIESRMFPGPKAEKVEVEA
jgi:hypothetical protein